MLIIDVFWNKYIICTIQYVRAVPMDDHNPLLALLVALGYPKVEGVCYGFSLRWLEAVFLGQEKFFEKRLFIINKCFNDLPFFLKRIEERKRLDLDIYEQELMAFDIPAFCDSLMLYQEPTQFPFLFPDECNQENIRLSSTVGSSASIETLGGLRKIYSEYSIYNSDEIINYLAGLQKIFDEVEHSSQPIGLLISNHNHVIPLCYKPGWGWIIRDVNVDSTERRDLIFRRADTPSSLVEKVVQAFEEDFHCSYIILDMDVVLTGMDPRIKTLKRKLALFKQFHLITPELIHRTERVSATEKESLFENILQRYDKHMLKKMRPYRAELLIDDAYFHELIVTGMNDNDIGFIYELIKYFKSDFDFNAQKNRILVYLAAKLGIEVLVSEFSSMSGTRQIDFNNATSKGKTPIYAAAKNGHVNVIKELLKLNRARVNFNSKAINGYAPIHIATQKKQHKIIKLFVAIANEDRTRINFNKTTRDGLTVVHMAAQDDFYKIMQELIKLNPSHIDFNKKTPNGVTGVWIAAARGCFKTIQVLGKLKKERIDFNQADDEGLTPVLIAIFKGHLQVIRALARLRSDRVNFNQASIEGYCPAYLTAQEGNEDIMGVLTQLDKDRINFNIPFLGRTPLFIASFKGHLNIVKQLIGLGGDRVDINLPTPEGATPIFIVAQKGHFDIFKELLLAGANYRSVFQSTVDNLKIWAEGEGNAEIVDKLEQFLKDKKSDEVVRMTPYDIAVITGHDKIAELILDQEHTRLTSKLLHSINYFQQQARTIFFSGEEKGKALQLARQLKRQLGVFSRDTKNNPEQKLIIQQQFSRHFNEGLPLLSRYTNILMKIKKTAQKIDLMPPTPVCSSGLKFFAPQGKDFPRSRKEVKSMVWAPRP